MCNNTFEDYKKAIKAKYEIEKEGEYSNHFNPPSAANLRNLCIKRFKSNINKDDLDVFASFFEFEFDSSKKNLIRGKDIDKLKPIGKFFLGITETPTEDTIHFAAILVDLKLRPFNRFKKNDITEENDLNFSSSDHEGIDVPKDDIKNVDGEKKRKKYFFLNVKQKILIRLKRKIKLTAIGVAIILLLGFVSIYFIFWNKGCMQWNNDHYDIVDCNLKTPDNNIVLLDPNVVNLKKIKVCDTTVFFRNGKASVFYARLSDSIQCFNQIAPHPETTKYLKPITNYMIDRYLKNKPCK